MVNFRKIDFYRRVPVDLTEPTTPGAIISIICGSFMIFLLLSEFYSFLQADERSEMVVQQEEGGKIRLNLDMTFPRMPCFVFSLDVLDIMGRHEVGVSSTLAKTRLSQDGHQVGILTSEHFGDQQANEMKHEGCHVRGYVDVNKVPGSFHISAHGLQHYVQRYLDGVLDCNHIVHSFFIGDVDLHPDLYPGSLRPLDNMNRATYSQGSTFEYFLDIIPTIYSSPQLIDMKTYQLTAHTHQFDTHPSHMPAVYFRYQLSPITVKFIARHKSFSHFLTYVCAIVGGVFTVAGLLNRMLQSSIVAFQKNLLGKNS
eukprot:NODE_3060_length_1038_cov_66.006586_g2917_i0.p1 GENE.NODE_3060_length_1038_cov_66.006586_g2917_i0~~NODE_3060_length_1038_cov_66.006586_g2917_i0.p1  ORF type:complete len:312 (+),score=67.23 NODE_3060_length_1038_cov_66.006586_g2917_i0:52-987(+)